MTAQFTDIAENVINEIDDILDLLPFRAVARGIKSLADRRICQIMLHSASTEPYEDIWSEFVGMGMIRILSYDGPFASRRLIDDMVGRHEDEVVTYGECHDPQDSDDDVSMRHFSEEEICFVASQVIVEGDQGCKIRFRPQSPSALIITSRTHLKFYCAQPYGSRYSATMLDKAVIEPDPHEGEEMREVQSQLGSSFVIQPRIAQSDIETPAALSTFTEPPLPPKSWLELVYLDTPLSLLLRGLPDWKVNRGNGNDSDPWDYYESYYDEYHGRRSFEEESYDIDNDSDFWRRAMD
jgi:hypothetical protein